MIIPLRLFELVLLFFLGWPSRLRSARLPPLVPCAVILVEVLVTFVVVVVVAFFFIVGNIPLGARVFAFKFCNARISSSL